MGKKDENTMRVTHSTEANASSDVVRLVKVLEEIQEFRKDSKQLNDIKTEVATVHCKIGEVEEFCVQNIEQVLNKMIKVMNQQESKLLDQDGRSQQKNIGAEGRSVEEFVDKMLRATLEFPHTTEWVLRECTGRSALWPPRTEIASRGL